MKNIVLTIALLAFTATLTRAQEGLTPTQALIREDSKTETPLTPQNVTLKIDNHATPITTLKPVTPAGAQVALLLDDGLRNSFGRNLKDMQAFIAALPPATEVLIGYMENGTVRIVQPFTTDHAAAARNLRIPLGAAGISASPYFCLSEFVKHWPGNPVESDRTPESIRPLTGTEVSTHKARFVLMLTNGVDPYNGSTSPLNQDSPYVASAVRDAQRAGVSVSSIYFGDAGVRGGAASFSGQGYLSQLAEATGGTAYYEGAFNPVDLAPYLTQFTHAVAETYVATFPASGKDLVRVKLTTDLPKVKLRHADEVRPGTQLAD
jgi:hypothetical protein